MVGRFASWVGDDADAWREDLEGEKGDSTLMKLKLVVLGVVEKVLVLVGYMDTKTGDCKGLVSIELLEIICSDQKIWESEI